MFRLYALPTLLELSVRPRKAHLVQAMEGLVLATAELVGTYAREPMRKAG